MSNHPRRMQQSPRTKAVKKDELAARLEALTQRNLELGRELEKQGGVLLPQPVPMQLLLQIQAAFEVLFPEGSIENLEWLVRFQELFYEHCLKGGQEQLDQAKADLARHELGIVEQKLIIPGNVQMPSMPPNGSDNN